MFTITMVMIVVVMMLTNASAATVRTLTAERRQRSATNGILFSSTSSVPQQLQIFTTMHSTAQDHNPKSAGRRNCGVPGAQDHSKKRPA